MSAPLAKANKLTLPTRKEGGKKLCILSYFPHKKNVYSKRCEGRGPPSRQQRAIIFFFLLESTWDVGSSILGCGFEYFPIATWNNHHTLSTLSTVGISSRMSVSNRTDSLDVSQ